MVNFPEIQPRGEAKIYALDAYRAQRHQAPRQERLRRLGTRFIPLVGALVFAGVGVARCDNNTRSNLFVQLNRGDALELYKSKQIDPSKVVLLRADESGMAWDLADKIATPGGATESVAWYEISPQADGQGDPGVQAGEVYVVARSLVDESAAQQKGLLISPEQLPR